MHGEQLLQFLYRTIQGVTQFEKFFAEVLFEMVQTSIEKDSATDNKVITLEPGTITYGNAAHG